jgi:hypothetical protein
VELESSAPLLDRISALLAVCCLAFSSCGIADSEEAIPEVCRANERTVLVDEKLSPEAPSSRLEFDDHEVLWASVVADVDYNRSTLFPSVATLHLIDADADPDLRRSSSGLRVIDGDPVIAFDREGQWRLVTDIPGRYPVWSGRGPEIVVATCPE